MLIEATDLSKMHGEGASRRTVLGPLSLQIGEGEFVAIVGPSGSGKSTLLALLGLLDRPTSGTILFDGARCERFDVQQAAAFRSARIGFVFQAYNLLPRLTIRQNIELPLAYLGVSSKERRRRSREALGMVGLLARADSRSHQLSGGEQQRVAIARALAASPALILADEPTGALDMKTAYEIMDLFEALHRDGHTILMVTHDRSIAHRAERQICVSDGRIASDTHELDRRPRVTSPSCVP